MSLEMEIKVENKEATKLRKEAKKRGIPVEDLIKEAMRAYLKLYQYQKEMSKSGF